MMNGCKRRERPAAKNCRESNSKSRSAGMALWSPRISSNMRKLTISTDMVLRSWEKFKPIFDDKKRSEVYFGIVNDVRNAIAHSRETMPFERDILSGIAKHLSNLLSLHGTSDNPSQRYYPTIESVTDSFGSIGSDTLGLSTGTTPRLEVGQTVRFQGRAVSAQGKSVKWYLSREKDVSIGVVQWRLGDGLDLDAEWVVPETEVGEVREYLISLVADSKWHRHQNFVPATQWATDDLRWFTYSINPPLDE